MRIADVGLASRERFSAIFNAPSLGRAGGAYPPEINEQLPSNPSLRARNDGRASPSDRFGNCSASILGRRGFGAPAPVDLSAEGVIAFGGSRQSKLSAIAARRICWKSFGVW